MATLDQAKVFLPPFTARLQLDAGYRHSFYVCYNSTSIVEMVVGLEVSLQKHQSHLNDKLIMALHHITQNRKTVLCSCNDDRFSNCCLENASMSSTSSCYLPLDLVHSSLKDFLTVQFTASLSTNILFFASHLCNLRFTFTPSN